MGCFSSKNGPGGRHKRKAGTFRCKLVLTWNGIFHAKLETSRICDSEYPAQKGINATASTLEKWSGEAQSDLKLGIGTGPVLCPAANLLVALFYQ
ncbi:MAG: hypothetical protein EBS01_00770 [Verrucomicrobia bacterium]|nr:hypothetical protein [Verrucomicrobiota bacterium]